MHRKIIKVFLGSPGDLEEERKAAKVIVDEENANHAYDLKYQIDLVGWEDTVSQRRRAQDAINVELDQCEYFVGLLWKKWGSPPGPDGHPYSSGFEEEYRRSVDRHEKTGKPEISLLFKELSADDLVDIGPQLEKVLAFHKETNEGKKQFYQKFQDLRDFERKFRATIAKFLKDQQREDSNPEALELQMPTKSDEKGKVRENGENESDVFDVSERRFLEEFIGKQKDGVNGYSAAEVARFRLLACTVSQSGNDSGRLGTHDANLVYRDLREVELSAGELTSLLSTAIENYGSSTVPLWHWLFHPHFEPRFALPIRTLWGEEKHRRNAFKLLEKLLITPSSFDRDVVINMKLSEQWFSESVSNELVVSALDYLGAVGDEGLEVNWAEFISRSEANVATSAVRASARIRVRASATDALKFVAQHDGTDLGTQLTEELIAKISTVETDVLRDCLNNKTHAFQRAIASELLDRDALTKSDAQRLCDSVDADIRLICVKALAKQSPEFTLADARKILVKPRKSNLLSLFASPQDTDFPGEKVFKDFKIGELGKLKYVDLLDLEKAQPFYSTEATLALYLYHFKQAKTQLVENLLNGFEKYFAEQLSNSFGASPKPSESVSKFVKDELLQASLEAFCSHATELDLPIVRTILDGNTASFSSEIAEFLAKHGSWQDAARVAKLSNNLKYGLGYSTLSLLRMADHTADNKSAANAILKLGAKRIADAWNLDMPNPVRVQLAIQMPKKLFALFDDQKIIDMLLLESDVVRETVALKAVLCHSKARLRKILDAYYNVGKSYYYNAIFWLDLGIAADQGVSRAFALRELKAK